MFLTCFHLHFSSEASGDGNTNSSDKKSKEFHVISNILFVWESKDCNEAFVQVLDPSARRRPVCLIWFKGANFKLVYA